MPPPDPPALATRPELPPLARGPVVSAMVALAVVLSAFSQAYGYHRDELYFRMLPLAWGYLDQPPLTPLLVRAFSALADEPWAIRIPATVCAVASVLVLAVITRELGGGRRAQLLCAWSYAFAASPLLFGHVMLTSSLDLVVWPLVVWLVIRALLRDQPRCWLVAGIVVGLSLYNKWLIATLLISLVAGLLIAGPRRVLATRWPWLAAGLALVIGSPNLVYQWAHDWPQLRIGAGLSAENAAEVRIQMWPFLALLLGPPLVAIWIAGIVALIRRPSWRPARFLVPAFAVLLAITWAGGTQIYYPLGLLVVLFAAGCVPVADFLAGAAKGWRVLAVALLVLNAAVSAVIGLPVLPLRVLGDSPVPGINQTAADQVGWPTYVRQIDRAYRALPPAERARTAIIVSNYGEAGAVARYGPELGLPAAVSGHNQLYDEARPPAGADVALIVGGQDARVAGDFDSCARVGVLDNGLGVDNEEQGEPIAVCRGPRSDWATLWPKFRHFD
ncbi:MAG: glycosyltransferase family 39 protein [Propionibacteriaceae bacterium]